MGTILIIILLVALTTACIFVIIKISKKYQKKKYPALHHLAAEFGGAFKQNKITGTINENRFEAGFDTRLETFVKILKRNKKKRCNA